MSVRVMAQVWELELPDSEKIVLLALADCANDEGGCWPSMRTLAGKCSKSDRTVQAAIKALVEKGHLSRVEKPGKGCNYYVHPELGTGMEGYNPRAFHYTYRISCETTGEFYVGARSCYSDPSADPYMGSGEWGKEVTRRGRGLRKTVLALFPSRGALAVAEQELTRELIGLPLCQNKRVASARGLRPLGGVAPEAVSPRSGFAPKATAQTPEAASDKPLRTITTKKGKPSSRARAKPKLPLPGNWGPKPLKPGSVCAQIVAAWQPGRIERELSKFRDHHLKTDAHWSDWDAAWRTWIQRASDFEPRKQHDRPDNPTSIAVQRLTGYGAHH